MARHHAALAVGHQHHLRPQGDQQRHAVPNGRAIGHIAADGAGLAHRATGKAVGEIGHLGAALGQRREGVVQAHRRANGQMVGVVFHFFQLGHAGQVDHLVKPAVLLRDPQTGVGAPGHQLRLGVAGPQRQQLGQGGGQGVMRVQGVALVGPGFQLAARCGGWVQVHGAGRVQDRAVAGAAAQIARDRFHGFFSRHRLALGAVVEVVQAHDKPGGAKPALAGVVV